MYVQSDSKYLITIKIILIMGVVVSSLIALGTVGAAIFYSFYFPDKDIPDCLKSWGGVVIGFYFGSWIAFVKDILNDYALPKPQQLKNTKLESPSPDTATE
jgi:hypothetical protein